MKPIRYVKVTSEKYLRNSIRSYFEGGQGCDLRWISGILRSSVPGAVKLRAVNMLRPRDTGI